MNRYTAQHYFQVKSVLNTALRNANMQTTWYGEGC